ncbi:RIP metalloprotease RseP [Vogesella indigofera]|uniref:RIP metalloprotease RseP n=1 Tax=Vogesella indigofera TaxID=45465 RepID=UPI00234EB51A|nr:RIP metalloprotease RseP [Vogesella indigofera]MDC7698393.1 RIP metalloprotease RseP [Vogesella indigofera]
MALLAFLLVIGVLVTFHEFGHYVAARYCGVKVLEFSIGFGKPLLTWQRGETSWKIGWIPLGGFVRMLDSREGAVSAADLPRAFNQRPPWQKILISIAGPLANLLLAVLLFFVVMQGEQTRLLPYVGSVAPQSAAAAAGVLPGDHIRAVNDTEVADWHALRGGLSDAIALDGRMVLYIARDGVDMTLAVDLPAFGLQQLNEQSLARLGLSPLRYHLALGELAPDGAAARAGLRQGDRLLGADGQPLASWPAWVSYVQARPGQAIRLRIQRNGQLREVVLTPDSSERNGQKVGRIGAGALPDVAWQQKIEQQVTVGAGEALQQALARTASLMASSLRMIGAMFTGTVALEALSGPLTIADYAGKSADLGLVPLLEFMALISVSLGVFNLLPVPVLDGGHLLYHVAEWIRGRPLPDRVYEIGQRLGMAFIMTVMLLALFNDFGRLFAG